MDYFDIKIFSLKFKLIIFYKFIKMNIKEIVTKGTENISLGVSLIIEKNNNDDLCCYLLNPNMEYH